MKPVLVCLHGWGASKHSFDELRENLKDTDVEILTPDLPGFGDEPEPSTPFTVDDYCDWVIKWMMKDERLTMKDDWYLLGHSHGGRIAIKLVTKKLQATSYKLPAHLFLCASAGIRHPRHLKRALGLMLAKGGKTILSLPGLKNLEPLGKKLLYKLVRVHDYEKASDVMRKTLINVSSEDLRPLLKNITVETDLFWGTGDRMTSYGDSQIMKKEISKSKLHTYKGVHHRVHRDRAKEIAEVIKNVLQPA